MKYGKFQFYKVRLEPSLDNISVEVYIFQFYKVRLELQQIHE